MGTADEHTGRKATVIGCELTMNHFCRKPGAQFFTPFLVAFIAAFGLMSLLTKASHRLLLALPPAAALANVPMSELIALLNEPEERTGPAERALASRGSESLSPLLQALRGRNTRIRAGAARTLAQGPEGRAQAIPLLLERLTDKSSDVRAWCACALGMMHERADLVVPALMRSTKDPDPRVRMISRLALGEFHALAEAAVPVLCHGLQDPDELARETAVEALRQIGQRPELTVPALAPFLHDRSRRTRIRALGGLIDFARTNSAALAVLTDASESMDAAVRNDAAWALKELESKPMESENGTGGLGPQAESVARCGDWDGARTERDPLQAFRRTAR